MSDIRLVQLRKFHDGEPVYVNPHYVTLVATEMVWPRTEMPPGHTEEKIPATTVHVIAASKNMTYMNASFAVRGTIEEVVEGISQFKRVIP